MEGDNQEIPDSTGKEYRQRIENEYEEALLQLFQAALKGNPFGFICTILRVSGMHVGHWDPLEESKQAFEDFRVLLKQSLSSGSPKSTLRMGLLTYCHAVEMTAIHEMLFNLLRCRNGQPFVVKPFIGFTRRKKGSVRSVPPSAAKKFSEIKKLAAATSESTIGRCIDEFFDDRIRNAFSHSDYCISEDSFRWTESGPADLISLRELNEKLTRSAAFYDVFFKIHQGALDNMGTSPRYHRLRNYEVLELLSKDGELYGFRVHFSNGSDAYYTRAPSKTEAMNLAFEQDGTVNFMCGMLDHLERRWKINGTVVTDWDAVNRQ